MKKRFQPPLFAVVFFAVSVAHGQTLFTWSPNPTDSLLSNAANWADGSLPATDGSAQLLFGESNRNLINIDVSLVEIQSIAFSNDYPSYFFGSQNGTQFMIGTGGVSVAANGSSSVVTDEDIFIGLAANQTWNIDGHLTVRGEIGQGEIPAALTKTGTGTLQLHGENTFSGNLVVQSGTLAIGTSSLTEGSIYAGPVGTGTLTLADNTTLRSTTEAVQLHNDISLGQNVTLDSGDFGDLQLSGNVDLRNAATTIKVAGENPVLFTGSFTAEGPATLTFTSPAGEFGGAAFADVFDAGYITSLTADNAALFFFADLPSESTLTLHATNLGYISAAAAPENENIPAASPAALLLRIPSPATFAGTFGLDTHPDSELIHNFADHLDFSTFTHTSFRFGSHSDALVSGTITPVDLGTISLFPFGGGSGHLVVLSNLADMPGKPASILVSTPATASPQYLVFRGNNTTTGLYSLDGIAAHLAVENSIAVLDSAGALPGGAAGKFTFGAGAPAYIGATEAAFGNFNDFLAHLAPGGHNALSILGLDSHDAYDAVLEYGVDTDNYDARKVAETIDLRSFNSIYLGSASDVILGATVYAPSNGILKLTGVDDGLLTIAAPLGTNVNSVEIGFGAGTASEEFGDGEIEMAAQQTYSGGTTLRSGTLSLSTSSHIDHDTSAILTGPLGTGTLTVENGVTDAVLAATGRDQILHNNIHLLRDLQIGQEDWIVRQETPAYLTLTGIISGGGGLDVRSPATLLGNNTYTGGTRLFSSSVYLGSNKALGTGPLEMRGPPSAPAGLIAHGADITLLNSINFGGSVSTTMSDGTLTLDGDIFLAQPTTLSSYGDTRITGPISGPGSLTLNKWDFDPLWISVKSPTTLSNTYQGGTRVNSGSLVFGNVSSIPLNGLLAVSSSGYVGAAFNTDVQADFLDRFDKPGTSGALGFDTTDLNTPIIIAEDLNLSSFGPNARLGTATAATLTGNILPAGDTTSPYQFGGRGGVLTVASNLGGGRSISVLSTIPLTLILTGDNRGANGLVASGSIVRFDGNHALPSTGNFVASNHGYIGYTEAVVGLTPNDFMTRWGTAGADAILGFDSVSTTSPRTIGEDISLVYTSNFNASTYIGTSTRVRLTGLLTPFGNTLRLTGVSTGNLEVDFPIASANVTTLVVGTPYSYISGKGAVTLNTANSYTGGTDLLSSHLILDNASALGTGTLRIGAFGSRLSVNPQAAGATITNPVDTGDTGDSGHKLILDATNPFTLAGNISGEGALDKTGSGTITLSGDNSALSGEVGIYDGKFTFAQNTSAGTGALNFWAEAGIAEFLGSAPSIGGLSGYSSNSRIDLAANSILTVNLPESTYYDSYAGSINGPGASVIYTAPSAASDSTLHLSGTSTYTGGTTINPGVTLIASNPAALGTTGTIAVNGGTLATSHGVTLASTATRPIVFTAGSIGGSGTISFHSSLVITNQLALTPGNSIGKLTLNFDSTAALILNSGGTYRWELADAAGTAGTGWDLIHVSGNIDLAALGGANGVFNISLHTIGQNGAAGLAANFNPNTSFSWAILTATSLPNFDAAKFNLIADSTTFLNATAGGTFSLSVENNTLLLNFAPVPEPSTWALMITGLAAIVVTTLRQRRRG